MSNIQEYQIMTGMIVFGTVLYGSDDLSSPNDLKATYTAIRHERELIDFLKS